MGSRGRFNARRESAAVTTFVVDLQERRKERERAALAEARDAGLDPCEVDVTPTEHEQRVADDLRGFDPECPFADSALHECTTNTGALTRPGQSCFPGSRASMANHPSAARS